MALSTTPKSANSGTIVLRDGTPTTPVSLTLSWANGDFNVSELKRRLNESTPVEVRGKFKGLTTGQRFYPTFSFTAVAVEFTNASAGALADFVMKQGGYASNVGTLGTGQPYTVDLVYTVDGTAFGDDDDHTFTLADCELTISYQEGSPANTFTINGTCYGTITGDLSAAEIS